MYNFNKTNLQAAYFQNDVADERVLANVLPVDPVDQNNIPRPLVRPEQVPPLLASLRAPPLAELRVSDRPPHRLVPHHFLHKLHELRHFGPPTNAASPRSVSNDLA